MKTGKRKQTQITATSVTPTHVSKEFTCRIWNLVLGQLALNDPVLIGSRKKYIQPILGTTVAKNVDSISARTLDGVVYSGR